MAAWIVPDFDFMTGAQAAALFSGHRPDVETADAIAKELRKLNLANPLLTSSS
jgi:hypothetical protein